MFFEVHLFIESNVSDILNESDEILSVKYQLIYTLRRQNDVRELRWIVPEIILELGKSFYKAIFETYKENDFEYIINVKKMIKPQYSNNIPIQTKPKMKAVRKMIKSNTNGMQISKID